eukprot:170176_1
MGHSLTIKAYKNNKHNTPKEKRSSTSLHDHRIYVSNLSENTTTTELRKFAKKAGNSVTFVDIRRIKRNGSSSRTMEGIIEFTDKKDYNYAIAHLYGARLVGKRVRVYSEADYVSESYGNSYKSVSRSKSRDRTSNTNNTHSSPVNVHNYTDCIVVNGDFNKIINKTKMIYYNDKAKELKGKC